MNTASQCERILKYLKPKRRTITRAQAMDQLGIANLPARILDLRKEGHAIADRWKTQRNRFGDMTKFKVYFLA